MAMKKTDSEGNPIVTMDAVKKAGFTNLRDYLNDKRGLKRRDGKAVERTKDITAPMQGPAVKANPAADQKDTYDRVMRGETRKRDAAPPSRGNVERETGNKMRKIIEEQAEKERMSTYPKGSGMKHGGSVRGDGCAIRGKTKGRTV